MNNQTIDSQCIIITGNAAAYGIDYAKEKGILATDYIIRADDGIAVPELRGILYLHGYLAEGFEELLAVAFA